MEVRTSIENDTEISKNIKIEIPRAFFQQQVDQRIRSAAGTVQLKGFRKGKAPLDMVERLYGGAVRGDVLTDLINNAYSTAIAENNLKVVGSPEVDVQGLEGNEAIHATAKVSLLPEPKIANYFNESFEAEVFKPCEHELEGELKRFQEMFSTTEDVEGRETLEEGDIAVIDYTGLVDGKESNDLKASNSTIELQKDKVREELLTGLVGVKLNETKDISIAFSDNVEDKSLVGKTAVYSVTPRKIQKRVLHELNDELAQKTRRAKTLDELKTNLTKQLDDNADRKNRMAKEQKLMEQLIEKNPFEVPAALVDEEIRQVLFEFGALDPKDEESYKRDITPFREGLQTAALTRVKREVIMEQLIKQEKIEIDDAALEEWLVKRTDQIGCGRDELNRMYNYPKNKENLRRFVAKEKMLDRLLEKANITEVEAKHEHN